MVNAIFLGYDPFGHPQYDTTRSEIGEIIYKLKYGNSRDGIDELADLVSTFIRKEWNAELDLIIPILPSRERDFQPVPVVEAISQKCNITLCQPVRKVKQTPEAKNIKDLAQRIKMLEEAFVIDDINLVKDKSMLLFDDLFGSGATLTVITNLLMKAGAKNVYVLTLTKTRTRNQ